MTRVVEIDMRELTITPVFKWIEVENIPKSETAGHAVMETKEVVEVRLAGNKNYSPVFPTDAFWKREGNKVITYAERWPDQYAAFKQGNPQEANGTPLEMLRPYGITPEQLSLCRALRIYSVEALHALEGSQAKSLGMSTNKLKEAANAFLAQRGSSMSQAAEMEALRARIAELESKSTTPPETDTTPQEIAQAIQTADDAYAGVADSELKDRIEAKSGQRPRGNPSRSTLVNALTELEAV